MSIFFRFYHDNACPALWAVTMTHNIDPREALPQVYSPVAAEISQRASEIEIELGEAHASPYTSPPQSPTSLQSTLRPDFTPTKLLPISTHSTPSSSPQPKRIKFQDILLHADSPSSSKVATSTLTEAWKHWEPVFAVIGYIGERQPHQALNHLDQVFRLLESILVHYHW